ncbi:MAG: RNA polymerase sigma factor [Bacteroidota bacterium]
MKEKEALYIEGLVRAGRKGDESAYYQLYQRYARAMLNAAYRILNHREEAEDALQEAFVKAFRQLPSYQGQASFGSWLKRIVIHTAIDHLRRRKSWLTWDEQEVEIVAEAPESKTHINLDLDRAYAALQQLPDGYRTVFSLYVLEGYDHQEIADILGISYATSNSQLSRAKKKLRALLTQIPDHG